MGRMLVNVNSLTIIQDVRVVYKVRKNVQVKKVTWR